MRTLAASVLLLLGACATRYDYEVRATNVGETPVDMEVRHLQSNGSRVMMDTAIAPGATSWYSYDVSHRRGPTGCEVTFETASATSRLHVANGEPLVVNVESQGEQIVVTRRPE